MARKARGANDLNQRNFVSEWFGYRTYPEVAQDPLGTRAQQERICPFLSKATGETQTCVKKETSLGICTISSCSNGPRQDWLVCPYRALDASIFEDVARRLFRPEATRKVVLVAAPYPGRRQGKKASFVRCKVRKSSNRLLSGTIGWRNLTFCH